jgi:hypothetical protein
VLASVAAESVTSHCQHVFKLFAIGHIFSLPAFACACVHVCARTRMHVCMYIYMKQCLPRTVLGRTMLRKGLLF